MSRIVIAVSFFLALIAAPCGFAGDGGTLQFQLSAPAGENPSPVMSDNALYSPEQAVMRLDGEGAEDVFVFKSVELPTFQLAVTRSEPPRLFSDVNEDGEVQTGEVFTGTESRPHFWEFENVGMPIRVGDVTREIRVDVACRHYGAIAYLSIDRIRSCYAGEVTIEGKAYPARGFFLSPFPKRSSGSNLRIVFDSDGDGFFHSFFDASASSGGAVFLGDALRTVDCNESVDAARVTISGVDAPTGTLSLSGKGLYRVNLRGENPDDRTYFFLPVSEGRAFTLPAGNYRVEGFWLRSTEDPAQFYQASRSDLRRGQAAGKDRLRIADGQETKFTVGGPLVQRVRVSSLLASLSGRVHVDYEGCTNPDGIDFSAERHSVPGEDGTGKGDLDDRRHPGPSMEIRDGNGNLIASSDFEYG